MQYPQDQKITKKMLHHFLSLRKDKAYRLESGSALVLGKKLTHELLSHVKAWVTTRLDLLPFRSTTLPIYLTTEEEFKRITGIENPEQIAAEVTLPQKKSLASACKLLILDRLQDPGNIGTLLRSALAFGFDGVYFIEPIADPFNDKIIRSSRGALFSLPFQYGTKEELTALLADHQTTLFIADLEGSSPSFSTFFPKIALLLGNEGQGVDPYFRTLGTQVKIPIASHTESLNVAVAGSIIMYLMGRSDV
jgi:TrmH family RNA methyltransferase